MRLGTRLALQVLKTLFIVDFYDGEMTPPVLLNCFFIAKFLHSQPEVQRKFFNWQLKNLELLNFGLELKKTLR